MCAVGRRVGRDGIEPPGMGALGASHAFFTSFNLRWTTSGRGRSSNEVRNSSARGGLGSRPSLLLQVLAMQQLTLGKILVHDVPRHARPPGEIIAASPDGDFCLLSLPLTHGEAELSYGRNVLRNGAVRPGTIGFVPPSVQIRMVIRKAWHAVRLVFPITLMSELFQDSGVRLDDPLFMSTPRQHVSLLGRQLLRVSNFDPLHEQLFLDGVARSLIACIQQRGSGNWKPRTSPRAFDGIEFARCVDFAEALTDEALDIAAWSAALDLSPAEFSRRFRGTTGKSPYRWFLDRRLDRAKEELTGGGRDLATLADTLGFASRSHFSEAFRRYTGMTPGRWRAAHAQ